VKGVECKGRKAKGWGRGRRRMTEDGGQMTEGGRGNWRLPISDCRFGKGTGADGGGRFAAKGRKRRKGKGPAAKGEVPRCMFQAQKGAEAGAVVSGESGFSGRRRMETVNPA
jgi:hypothetical protein